MPLTLRVLLVALAWLASSGAEVARACPDCLVGRAARTQVWDQDFAFHLTVALIPFALVALASAWADRIGRPPSTDRSQ